MSSSQQPETGLTPNPDEVDYVRPGRRPDEPTGRAAKHAVSIVFIGSGFAFATWASQIPQLRDRLG